MRKAPGEEHFHGCYQTPPMVLSVKKPVLLIYFPDVFGIPACH
jgi:hypothetical protein